MSDVDHETRAVYIGAFATAEERGELDRMRRVDVSVDGGVSWSVDADKLQARSQRVDAQLTALESKYAAAVADADLGRRRAAVRALNMPIEDADVELLAGDAFEEKAPAAAIREWCASGKPLLILSGTTGTGKTLAAARELLRTGGKYIAARDVSRLFLAQFGEEAEQARALIEVAGLLVLDDIGREKNHEAMQTGLIELLDYRRRDGRRNIWITNLPRVEFTKRYSDERLLSRIAGAGIWHAKNASDMRVKAK